MGTLTNLRKAMLDSSTTALIPYDLEAALNEELIRLQPLLELLNVETANGKTHEYSLRTAHPQGWFEGEQTPMAQLASTYTRKSVQLKIGRIWGGVTGFAQAVDEPFINALAAELEGSLQGMSDLLEYSILFGCGNDATFTGDAYQTTGVLPLIYRNAAATNVIGGGAAKVTLDMLDQCLAVGQKYRQTQNDPYIWLMSTRMKQVVDGLQTKVQLPLQTVQLADGKIEMAAYGRAPILECNDLIPGTSSPAVTTALASGGTIPDATTYNYRISSVTMYGECVAGTEGTDRTTTSPNFKINLTWTADPAALLYMIWRQPGGSGTFYLMDIIAAKTYDAAGTVNGTVAAYSDTGAIATNLAVSPLEASNEQIVLINRHPRRGAQWLGRVDDMGRQLNNLVSYVELARTKDTYDYMLKAYFAIMMRYTNLGAVLRHVKLA